MSFLQQINVIVFHLSILFDFKKLFAADGELQHQTLLHLALKKYQNDLIFAIFHIFNNIFFIYLNYTTKI